MGAAPPQVTVTAPEQGVPALTVEDVAGMKVEDLKAVLRLRGRKVCGKKPELQDRLMECIQQNVPMSTTAVERDGSMSGLDVTAK